MPPVSDNIWVGDLPAGMDKGTLATLFEAYGTVLECRILPGKEDGSKPCAMVRFASTDMAQWVVENLNGNIPEGLSEPIIARFANSPSGKGKGDGGGWGAAKGGGGGWASEPYGGGDGAKGGGKSGGFVPPSPSDNVWVGDLPVGTEKPDLANIFEAYGQIQDCRILPGRDASAKPCAMVRFASVEMAAWVVENLNGNIPQGLAEPIIARFANGGGGAGSKGAGGGGGWQAPASAPVQGGGGWQAAGGGGGWQAAGKGGAGGGGKAKKGDAPGSFQALFQSVKGAGILGGGKVPDDCQCFIKNLPSDTVDDDLYKLFSPFGAIPPAGVKAMANADGTCKGFGFVDFSDAEAASTAVLALDGHTTSDGTTISVSTKKPGKGASGGKGK